MISGITLLTGLMCAATPLPASAPALEAAAPDVAALIARLRQPAPADTVFVEVRFLRVLQRPLRLRGELHYGGAGTLGKRVDQPYRETTTIADGNVQVQREGKAPRVFSLDRAPELGALLASFSALLGGDAQTLNQYYAIALATRGANWRLTLTPRDSAFSRQLHDIVVDGADTRTRCFILHEADGDSSTMLLGDLAATTLPESPTPAALDALCRGSTP